MDEFDPKAYENWTPAAKERALQRINELAGSTWRPFYCDVPTCDGKAHDDWAWSHARADQRPPADLDWIVWAAISGRGGGKTRQGSEYTNRVVEKVPRIIIVAPTGGDLREVIVEGESGLIATAKPDFRPLYEPSKRRVTWPNGARALLVSAEEPERLRGPQSYYSWMDEFAIYPDAQAVWDNLSFGLRLGKRPRCLVTTTPRPRPALKEILKSDTTRISRASTYDNLHNLAPTFAEKLIKRFEGTRLGRQELHAEMLEDVEGALWTWDMISEAKIDSIPEDLDRIVVGVDPAGTSNRKSDETGIVVVGVKDGILYVIADRSGRYTPLGWARMVKHAYDEFSADAVVAEVNYGGEMVEHVMRSSDLAARIVTIHAKRGKSSRAEPIVGLYEQGRVRHGPGLNDLETELTEFVPGESASPNRMDAMVYAATMVSNKKGVAEIASPVHLKRVV